MTGKPAIMVGSVGLDADLQASFANLASGGPQASRTGVGPLLERLARDEFDLVAVGRALLGDPNWARKIRAGEPDRIAAFVAHAFSTLT